MRRICLLVDADAARRHLYLREMAILPDYGAVHRWLESLGFPVSFAVDLDVENDDVVWTMPVARSLDVPILELRQCGLVARYNTDDAVRLMERDKRISLVHIGTRS